MPAYKSFIPEGAIFEMEMEYPTTSNLEDKTKQNNAIKDKKQT